MIERLADIGARIAGVRQLGAVVNAMRGIAAARVQQARGQLEAVDRYAATIAMAIGRALALVPGGHVGGTKPSGRLAIVLFCAEQGFAGAFNERLIESAGAALAEAELFLIGTRGAVAAAERGIVARWTRAMPSHSPGIPKLADAITEALSVRIAKGAVDRLDVIFCRARGLERWTLLPFDMTRFPRPVDSHVPLVNLAPALLLSGLTGDYLHAQLCAAALHAFAAENQARMEAMAAAHGQIEQQLASLEATQRMVRQNEITEEIIELAAGETASRRGRNAAAFATRSLSGISNAAGAG